MFRFLTENILEFFSTIKRSSRYFVIIWALIVSTPKEIEEFEEG